MKEILMDEIKFKDKEIEAIERYIPSNLVQITAEVEMLDKGWADSIINKIIWGESKHFYE